MKDLVKNLTGKSLYLLLIAISLFAVAFIISKYIIGTTSARYYANLIENDIKSKERSFQKLTRDTALLRTLSDQTYTEEILQTVLEKEIGYSFFINKKDTANNRDLIFWNTQTAIPPINFLDESDASIKYIKIIGTTVSKLPKWHTGKGDMGYIFVDEILVN